MDSPFDNRIGTVSNGVTTWTLYDGSSPIMDFSGSGALEVRYLQGPTGIVARESASGVIAWYLSDRLGTVSDVIDNLGNVIDHVDYTAFGSVIDETAPGAGDRFVSFAGLLRDNVTGLNLAVERAENPGLGRWTQQDPLSFAAGDANLYRYVGNGATAGTDPRGEDDEASFGIWITPLGFDYWLENNWIMGGPGVFTGRPGILGGPGILHPGAPPPHRGMFICTFRGTTAPNPVEPPIPTPEPPEPSHKEPPKDMNPRPIAPKVPPTWHPPLRLPA